MLERFTKVIEYILVVMFLAFVLMTFVNTVGRYLFDISFPWAEEVSRYLFVYVVFIGAAIGFKRKIHIGVDFLTEKLSGFRKKIVDLIVYIGIFYFSFILAKYGWEATQLTMGQYSPGLGQKFKMAYVYFSIPLCAVITMIMIGDLIYQDWFKNTGKKDGELTC